MSKGRIVAGGLAPHPPHLLYAENPPQNEPNAECGWEVLRWGYERCRKSILELEPDVLIVHSPHWKTTQGHHLLAVDHFEGLSVDPIFPNLFRYSYELDVDVELAEAIHEEGVNEGLEMQMMRNPDFRVDYGTIVACHLSRPAWDLPIVSISSNRSASYYGVEVMQEMAAALGRATKKAIAGSGKRAALLSSCSLSHRHFTDEASIPEDMSREHITSHALYLWDMQLIEMIKKGQTRQMVDVMPEFITQAISEMDAGSFSWLMSAMDYPTEPGEVYAYGTVIGTGNAVAGWFPEGVPA